jgi:hypothetical protein
MWELYVVKDDRQRPRNSSKIPNRKPDNSHVKKAIDNAEAVLRDSIEPALIRGLDGYQRKQVQRHFEKSQEYQVKFYKEKEETILRVYPVGFIRRLTEQKAQEVLMKGRPEELPPMGSFERFIVHDYLKDREGVRTESRGEGRDRRVEIQPLFGRNPKKAKRKLTR